MGWIPTAPDIHLGHTVVLEQDAPAAGLGHPGDLPDRRLHPRLIGDPSGRNTTRPPLTAEQIKANAETYYTQAAWCSTPARTEIRYNSEWCDQLGARGMMSCRPSYTVARMMERNDFTSAFPNGVPSACMNSLPADAGL